MLTDRENRMNMQMMVVGQRGWGSVGISFDGFNVHSKVESSAIG